MKEFHFQKNLLEQPFTVQRIFSTLSKNITSLSQRDIDGGLGDFQRSKMRRLARRKVKDKTSDCKELIPSCTSETPNIAIKGSVFIWVPRAFVKIFKKISPEFV